MSWEKEQLNTSLDDGLGIAIIHWANRVVRVVLVSTLIFVVDFHRSLILGGISIEKFCLKIYLINHLIFGL